MALTYDSTEDKWSDSITITQQTGSKLTLATNDQYVNGDIEFTIGVTGGSASIPTADSANIITSNPTITYGTNKITVSHSANKNITPAVTPGWVSAGTEGTISTNGSTNYSSLSFPSTTTSFSITNAGTISVTNNGTFSLTNGTNGIMTITNNSTKTTNAITNAGSINTITNNASKTIGTITNNGTLTTVTNAGTITTLANNSSKTIATLTNQGTITTLNNSGTVTVKSASTSGGVVKVNAYPASGSSLDGDKTIVSSGRWQCVNSSNTVVTTVTNGTFYGKVIVPQGTASSNFANSGLDTYFNSGSSTNWDVYITPRHTISPAGYIAAVSNSAGTTSYYKIKTSTQTTTGTTVSGTSVSTTPSVSWTTGWITSGSIGPVTFANTATSGQSYVDISNTSNAPYLIANNYLYINEGYTDNVKISIAKLLPNSYQQLVFAENNDILQGKTSYNAQGVLSTGTIQTYSGSCTCGTSTDFTSNPTSLTVGEEKITGSLLLNKSSGAKLTLNTSTRYLNKNVELILGAETANPTFKGGALSGEAIATSASVTETIIVPQQTITVSSTYTSLQSNAALVAGEEYVYMINGVTSSGTALSRYGSIALGNEGNGTWFEYDNGMYFDVGDSSFYGTYIVKIVKQTTSSGGVDISNTTNNSGIAFTTSCTATRAVIQYDDPVDGWVTKSSNDTAVATTSANLTTKTYYINKINLPLEKFVDIEVYQDSTTKITFRFTTDDSGNTVVTEPT